MVFEMKKLLIALCSVCLFTACTDKVKYVDVFGECKYIEIDGQPMMCSEMENPNEFEKIYVDPCLEVVKENGVLPRTDKCEY